MASSILVAIIFLYLGTAVHDFVRTPKENRNIRITNGAQVITHVGILSALGLYYLGASSLLFYGVLAAAMTLPFSAAFAAPYVSNGPYPRGRFLVPAPRGSATLPTLDRDTEAMRRGYCERSGIDFDTWRLHEALHRESSAWESLYYQSKETHPEQARIAFAAAIGWAYASSRVARRMYRRRDRPVLQGLERTLLPFPFVLWLEWRRGHYSQGVTSNAATRFAYRRALQEAATRVRASGIRI